MTVEVVASGLGFTEGPAVLHDGRVAVTSISHGCVYIIDTASRDRQRIVTGGGPNGLAVGPDGAIYVAQNGGIFGASGPAEPGVQMICGGRVEYLAEEMGAPNDLVFGPDGRLWVTDTRAEIDFAHPDETKPGWVWAIDTSTGTKELMLDSGPVFINGLGFAESSPQLFVTTTSSGQLMSFDIAALGHSEGRVLCTFDNGWPDGMVVLPDGNMWVALSGGHRLDLVAPDGQIVDTAALPDGSLPTNVCIDVEQPNGLYVTASFHEALLRIRL